MSMRVYIEDEKATELKQRRCYRVDKENIVGHNEYYLHIEEDDDHEIKLAQATLQSVTRATIHKRFCNCIVEPGIYEHGNAEAKADFWNHNSDQDLFQMIKIEADSIEGARQMLELLRTGQIRPIKKWCGHKELKPEYKADQLPEDTADTTTDSDQPNG